MSLSYAEATFPSVSIFAEFWVSMGLKRCFPGDLEADMEYKSYDFCSQKVGVGPELLLWLRHVVPYLPTHRVGVEADSRFCHVTSFSCSC